MRDPRYDILFEPVKIGPVVAKNRFYQVPHCNGMGHTSPRGVAGMRGVKAEGGWAVISTEEVEIHHSGDITPARQGRLWDDRDIPALTLMTEAVHEHGALAAIELAYHGAVAANHYSREVPMAPGDHVSMYSLAPTQARAMDKNDIRAHRRWHKNAAIRAQRAGFDIIYVYAGHDLSLAMHFLQIRRNQRSDEYGGSLTNRVRFLRELLEETKEAVGDRCAVALRLAVDEMLGSEGISSQAEGRDIVESIAELPDLWDVNVSGWNNDSSTSRFSPEGSQEDFIKFVKRVTTKPVVGVGRFTSPDTMVSQIRRGVLDFIGAARPSIADPFLPKKIEAGEIDDIRECIGCNICVASDLTGSPIRCTQNPTMGEEWRRGWHPERLPPSTSNESFLVIGAGPAGLECARVLGGRGYQVHLAEASRVLGGRVTRESKLPGLAAWARVSDYRIRQVQKMPNVSVYLDSLIGAQHVLEFGAERVVIATGGRWRRDGVGRTNLKPIPGFEGSSLYTPDDIMEGRMPEGDVVVFDDDNFYMAGLLAEKLRSVNVGVTLVTPAAMVSAWTEYTLEQHAIQKRLLDLGVVIATCRNIVGFHESEVSAACIYTGTMIKLPATALVTVTARSTSDDIYHALQAQPDALRSVGIVQVARIGDALCPSTIAAAVYSGHRFAREYDFPASDQVPFKREHATYIES
jgi:dimethylamine/trimethylamine dehydrogenase